jgi:hypothetical protein
MSEDAIQFKWIVLIKEGLETLFRHDPDVFVAGDLLLVSGRLSVWQPGCVSWALNQIEPHPHDVDFDT